MKASPTDMRISERVSVFGSSASELGCSGSGFSSAAELTSWGSSASGGAPERVYKVGHATSADGVAWQKDGRQLIADKLARSECQALPTVIQIGARYHMFFCYRRQFDFRNDREGAYRLGYAYSDDLANWVRDDAGAGIDVSPDGWDSDMQCYPNVFECEGNIYLLYNGNEFGRLGFGLAVLEH